MTYEQYWHGDPWMVVAYREAFILKQRKRNEELWLQGAYVAEAVSVAIHNSFEKNKVKYRESPLDIYPKTYAEKQEEIRKERQKVVQQLSILSAQFKIKQKGTDLDGKS